MIRRILASLLLTVFAATLAFAGDPTPTPQLERVQLQLNWFPEAEHGGFYAALVHGYYKEAGLNVEILPGGVDVPVLSMVGLGRVRFGVENADQLLLARAEGAPLVALTAPMQVSPRCIMVHEKSGIRSFEDLHDITLAMSAKTAFAEWLTKKYPLKNVQVVQYAGNVTQFLVDEKYACQGYNISEPFVAKSKGGDPRVLMVSDTGFNPYTSMLFTNEKSLAQHPDLMRRMVEASNEGWKKYVEDPAETNAYIHKMNPEMGMDILDFGARELKPMVLDEAGRRDGVGTMSLERWKTLASQLEEIGLLKPGAVKPGQAFTTQFLKPAGR